MNDSELHVLRRWAFEQAADYSKAAGAHPALEAILANAATIEGYVVGTPAEAQACVAPRPAVSPISDLSDQGVEITPIGETANNPEPENPAGAPEEEAKPLRGANAQREADRLIAQIGDLGAGGCEKPVFDRLPKAQQKRVQEALDAAMPSGGTTEPSPAPEPPVDAPEAQDDDDSWLFDNDDAPPREPEPPHALIAPRGNVEKFPTLDALRARFENILKDCASEREVVDFGSLNPGLADQVQSAGGDWTEWQDYTGEVCKKLRAAAAKTGSSEDDENLMPEFLRKG